MEQVHSDAIEEKPLWRRVIDFPLGALVIAMAVFIVANAVGIVVGRSVPRMDSVAQLAVTSAINIALVFAAYKLIIARLGERPRDELRMADAPAGLGLGLAAGALVFSAVVGVAAIFDVYNIVGEGGTRQLLYLLIATAIVPGFMEEVLFRGILFRWIEEFGGTWAGLVFSSLAFGFAHYSNPNSTVVACLWIALESGVLLGGAYILTRSLWMPIGLHAAWNFTQGFIFDVPVSGLDQEGLVEAELSGPQILTGGSFGLEASVIALAISTAVGIWLVALAVRRGQLVEPWWVRRRLERAVA